MPRTAYVTGSNGFLGINIIQQLLDDGWNVIALRRKTSNTRDLDRLSVTQVEGDVLDRASLERTLPEGVDALFHVAADTGMWSQLNARQNRINIEGTRNVVEAALAKQAKRLIHTSSIGAFGPVFDEEITEETPSRALHGSINYYRSKYLAEQEVFKGVERGLDAVIMNPAQIIGPYDYHYNPQFFTAIRQGKMLGVPRGVSVAGHVRDYARAHVTAVDKGRKGERYLLGGVSASFQDIFDTVGGILGKPPSKRFVLPPLLLSSLALILDKVSQVTRREPMLTPEKVLLLNNVVRINCTKAERELGFSTCSLHEMFYDCYQWMQQAGVK